MAGTVTYREAVALGAVRLGPSPTGRRDSEVLLMHAAGVDRVFLMTRADEPVAPEPLALYLGLLSRRIAHEPLQYILGEQEFFGLRFEVTPAVLIPRPETEHLVEALLERVSRAAALTIADVGTGSGAIAVALAHALPQARVVALDLSTAALEVARRNAEANGVGDRVEFFESDLMAAVQGRVFDAVVSNPPYIADGERASLEAQVRDFEPGSALFAGPTGLEVYERLIPQAHAALKPGGWLVMEIGAGQRDGVAALLAGWDGVGFVDDLQGIPRVAVAGKSGFWLPATSR